MSENIECRVTRRRGSWVAQVPEHGVYGHGKTLKAVRESVVGGLAYIGVTAEVSVIAVTPELENLRTAEDAYKTALREAVDALALDSTTSGDVAQATGVSTKQVRALLMPYTNRITRSPRTRHRPKNS